jgi:hypothetical protein
MFIVLLTIVVSLCLNYLLVTGHERLLSESIARGSVSAKLLKDSPVIMTAFSILLPAVSVVSTVCVLVFLKCWLPYARDLSCDTEKDS